MGYDTYDINYYEGNGYLLKIKGQIEDIIKTLILNGFNLSKNVFVLDLDDGDEIGKNPTIFFGTLKSKLNIELEGPLEILNHHYSLDYMILDKIVNNPIKEMDKIKKIFKKNVKVSKGSFRMLTSLHANILNYEGDNSD